MFVSYLTPRSREVERLCVMQAIIDVQESIAHGDSLPSDGSTTPDLERPATTCAPRPSHRGLSLRRVQQKHPAAVASLGTRANGIWWNSVPFPSTFSSRP